MHNLLFLDVTIDIAGLFSNKHMEIYSYLIFKKKKCLKTIVNIYNIGF